MKQLIQATLYLLFWLSSSSVFAQLDATFPLSRMVFQRNNANQATFQVAGSFTSPIDRVEIQVVNRVTSATVTSWTTVQTNPANGQFVGSLTLSGGWYQLNFRGMLGSTVVGTDAIDRVGVGEVFAVLGHSNAQGSTCSIESCNWTCNLCPTLDGANDDRVNCVRLNLNNSANFNNPAFDQYENAADTRYLPGLTAFEKLDTYVGESPFARFAWFWGKMGDMLVQQLGVPILLYNAGFGGSNMEHVYKSAYDIPFQHGFVRYDLRMPYVNLRNIMNLYVPSTGLRGVLLQHGINDRGNQTADIITHNLGVIDKVRSEFNLPSLAWIVCKDSYANQPFQNVRSAQDAIINRGEWANPQFVDNIFPGPDLDEVVMYNPNYSIEQNANDPSIRWRPDGIHYSQSGQQEVAVRWSNVLAQQSLLSSITPVLSLTQPLANITCPVSATGLNISFPAGYEEYNWGDGTTNQSRNLGAGTYTVRLRTPSNRIFFPPAVTIPAYNKPAQPVITAVGGFTSLCTTSTLSLTTSIGGPVRWSTNQTAPSITISTPGTYTAQSSEAFYGCVSAPGVFPVSIGQADLALSMSADKRVLKVGDEVTYTITVTNKGPCDPMAFTWRDRLPGNVQYISSTDNLSVGAGNEVFGSLSNGLSANSSITHRFRARIQQPGYYLNAAEVSAANRTDPNSVPNSGTGDGQDDTAMADLRTVESSTAVYQSPNPNQTPLPPVQSNQPTPDPAKADLSLQLRSDRRVIQMGQLVSLTLVISNTGGATATSVTVGQTLPAGLQFNTSANGLTLVNGVVRGSVASLGAGQSVSLSFTATATAVGPQMTNSEILTASPADPDSTPGNGYTNGEDDTDQLDVRVVN